jgi:hypothetical protein
LVDFNGVTENKVKEVNTVPLMNAAETQRLTTLAALKQSLLH